MMFNICSCFEWIWAPIVVCSPDWGKEMIFWHKGSILVRKSKIRSRANTVPQADQNPTLKVKSLSLIKSLMQELLLVLERS